MAFCPNCGSQIPEGGDTCPNCGTSFAAVRAAFAFDPKDHTAEFEAKDISDNKIFVAAAYLLIPFGLIYALVVSQKSPYTLFHVKQVLKISLCEIPYHLLMGLFFAIWGWLVPAIGYIVLIFVRLAFYFQAANGKAKEAAFVSSVKALE